MFDYLSSFSMKSVQNQARDSLAATNQLPGGTAGGRIALAVEDVQAACLEWKGKAGRR